jgi:hypothetical protein
VALGKTRAVATPYNRLTVAKTTDTGKDQGIAFLKHLNFYRRQVMKDFIWTHLTDLFRSRNSVSETQMLQWAKTEYGKEWQYAYYHVLPNLIKNKEKGVNK